MRLTQSQLAERVGVATQTIVRIESGKPVTRSASSWPKFEAAFEWPEDFISRYVAGEVDELALAGNLRRDPVPEGDLTGMLHDVMFEVFGFAAPDIPLSKIREAERIALEVAKRHGYVPALRQPEASTDQDGEDANKA